MSGASPIEWTDATWNPVRGCSRVSEGCRNCYAERHAARFAKPGLPFHGFAKVVAPRDGLDRVGGRRNGWTGKVELIPRLLDWPLRRKKPMRIFVNSMSDLFHEGLSNEAIAAVFGVMAAAPQHTFQVLTKRPERMLAWFEWAARCEEAIGTDVILYEAALALGDGSNADYDRQVSLLRERSESIADDLKWPLPNVWLGVSVENQATADERIPLLLQTPAAKRFVSYEPALGPVSWRWMNAWPENAPTTAMNPGGRTNDLDGLRRLDWVIVGGESGPGARPFDVAWARSTVEQCKAAGVACFVKQLGSWPLVYRSEADRIVEAGGDLEWDDSDEHNSARLKFRDRKGGDWSEWPEDIRVREFPR